MKHECKLRTDQYVIIYSQFVQATRHSNPFSAYNNQNPYLRDYDKFSGHQRLFLLIKFPRIGIHHLNSASKISFFPRSGSEPGIFLIFVYFLSPMQRLRPLGYCAPLVKYLFSLGFSRSQENLSRLIKLMKITLKSRYP